MLPLVFPGVLIIPPALPPTRPRTFVPPEPTEEMLAERAAEVDAIIAAKKRSATVPLGVRFLRLLESRSVQHDMTTPTIFHRILKRRNSIPNRPFLGYHDTSPRLQVYFRYKNPNSKTKM